jgi:hypothetical protein
MMTSYTWMFRSSYEKLRARILNKNTIITLIRPEYHTFFESAYVPICSFVLFSKPLPDLKGSYIDLKNFYDADIQGPKALEIIHAYTGYLKEA